jgi:cell division protein FtsB
VILFTCFIYLIWFSCRFIFIVDLISALRDRSIFMSVVNEGLLGRISSLKAALEHLDRKFRKLKEENVELKREHSKCYLKRQIKFLYR